MKQLQLFTILNKKRLLIIFTVSFITILLTRSFNIIFIALSILLTYKIFSPLLIRKVFDTFIFKLLLVFFIYIIILQCIILSSWILYNNFPLDSTPLLTLLFLVIIYIYQYFVLKIYSKKEIITIHKQPIIQTGDIISITVAVIMTLLIVAPPLIKNGINSQSSIITLSSTSDDAAHIELISDRMQFNRGMLCRSDAMKNIRNYNCTYPAGWHSANAVLIESINPKVKIGFESLIAYVISNVFWFFVLIFTFSRVIYSTCKSLLGNKMSSPVIVWVFFSSLLFSFLFLVDNFREGFYSFTPQLIAALLLVPLLIQLSQQNSKKRQYHGTLLMIAIICAGGSLSWFLMLPAFLLMVILLIFDCIKSSSNKYETTKNLISNIYSRLAFYGLLIVAILVQLLATSTDTSSGQALSLKTLLTTGGIATHSWLFYLFILMGVITGLLLTPKKHEKDFRYLLYPAVSILLFAGFIYTLQMSFTGSNSYYYYKVLNIFTIISLVISLAGIAMFINYLSANKSSFTANIFSAVIILMIAQFIGLNPADIKFIKGNRDLPNTVYQSIYSNLKNNEDKERYYEKKYVFYLVQSNYNDTSTMLVKSGKPHDDCFKDIRGAFNSGESIDSRLATVIKSSCSGYIVEIITNDDHEKALLDLIYDLKLQNIVNIKNYKNITLENKI